MDNLRTKPFASLSQAGAPAAKAMAGAAFPPSWRALRARTWLRALPADPTLTGASRPAGTHYTGTLGGAKSCLASASHFPFGGPGGAS